MLTSRFEVLGLEIVVTSNSPGLLQGARAIQPDAHGPVLATGTIAIELVDEGDLWSIRHDDQRFVSSASPEDFAHLLQALLTKLTCARLTNFTLIPASLATLPDRRVVVAGMPGSGASALTRALLARGAAVHGDHLVVLTCGRIIPVPRRLRAREEEWPPDPRRLVEPAGDPDPHLALTIVWLERGDGGGVRPLPRYEMAKNLISIVVEPLHDPGRKIAELNSLVAASDAFLARSGSPAEIAAGIERLGGSLERAVSSSRRTRVPEQHRRSPHRSATPTSCEAPAPLSFPAARNVRVSIVIPVFNGLRYTRECLEALREHTPGDYEVIVVDNASEDGTPEYLRAIDGLSIVRNEENLGFARACNAGARRARGRYLLFLNNDAVPLPGWLPPLLETAERREKTGAVGCLLLYPGDRTVQHAGVCMDERGRPYHIFRHHAGDAAEAVCDREMPAVTGACLLTPRSLFLDCGGFDEGYVNGLEDIDYCLRVGELGRRVFYTGASVLLHHESVSEGRLDDKSQQANLRRFSARWGEKIRPDNVADYIPEGATNTSFNQYEAGSARLRHGTGAIEGARLVCRPGEHAEGHCVYGPGLFVLGPQSLRVAFHLQVGADSPPHQRIASLDIYDRREGKILRHQEIRASQIRESAGGIVLATPVARGQELEFRVYWHGEGELDFSHLTAAISAGTGAARTGRPTRHFLSLCAIAKDETPFLREWVEFHRIVGVEHFFIFDNDSRTPIAETLADSIAQGVVTVREITGSGRQLPAYNAGLSEFGPTSRWIGFLDLDEFLMPRASGDLRPLLQEYAGFGGLAVNWMMFGPSGHRTRPAGLQLEQYTLRMPDDWTANRHVKCVVQPDAVLRFDNPHFALFHEGLYCVGENFDRVEGPFRPLSVERIRINHYFTRSEQDFREKMDRGAVDGGKAKGFDSFEIYQAQATVRDLTALQYVPALKKKSV